MRAFKKKTTDKKTLQDLVPLNALPDERFAEVMDKIVVEEIRSRGYLFRKGDRDNQSIYLLDGKVNLIDGRRKVTSEIEGGTDSSRYPIASQQPRTLSARAVTRVVIARIDSGMLDAYLNGDHASGTEVTEINSDSNEDWMTRMLQSEAFEKIPPAGIQRLLMRMKSLPVQAGEVVIREGDVGDYFYTIHSGRCIITRGATPGAEQEVLAELSSGECFGEEALVSDRRRNATVTMLTDGVLMRLAKKDFIELLQKPLVRYVSYAVAAAMVDDGAVWVDVRSEGEYEEGAIEDSVNIPLSTLRNEIPELVFNAQYIICCDTGSRSVSAAFILSHKGFEVYVLESGLNGMTLDEFTHAGLPTHGSGLVPAAGAVEQRQVKAAGSDPGLDIAEDGEPVEIESLRRENQALRQQLHAHQREDEASFKRQLQLQSAEEEKQLLREQNALLQHEIGESKQLIQTLRSAAGKTAEDERRLQQHVASAQQSLRLQIEHLEYESIQYAQHVEALQQELQAANEQLGRFEVESQARLHDRERLVETLHAELAQARQDSDELQALREQSAQAVRQVESLQAELLAAQEQIGQSRADSEAWQQEQQRVKTLRVELEHAEQHGQALQQEIEVLQRERQSADERGAELEHVHQQLAQAQQENDALGGKLAAAQDRADEFQQQLKQLTSQHEVALEELQERNQQLAEELAHTHAGRQELEGQIEALQNRHQEIQQQLEASRSETDASQDRLQQLQEHNHQLAEELAHTHAGRQELEGQIEALQNRHQEIQQQLEASRSEADDSQDRLQQLQQQVESLQGENQHLRDQHQGLADHARDLEAEKQAMLDRLQTLQQELESQGNNLGDQAAAYEQQLADLRDQLEQARAAAGMEQQGLEAMLQEYQEYKKEAQARFEQQQHDHEALLQQQQQLTDEREAVAGERDELRQRLAAADNDLGAQQREIEQLNAAIASAKDAADKEIQMLNERLADEQARASQAEQGGVEQAEQARALQEDLERREQAANELLAELQAAKQQAEEGSQGLLQLEAEAQAARQEYQVELEALRADLEGRHDLEREMQGQIDRLGKQLEQSAESLQQLRDEAQENDQRLRDELTDERRARAEERAEMAARQKDLKQQLVEVAEKHESVLASQAKVLEQAREAARREERERHQHEPGQPGQSGEQVAALQAELDRLREEMAEALAQEQKRSSSELAVAREQRAQAKAEIVGLNSRLNQLTQERDEAVSVREALEKQIHALRNNIPEASAAAGPKAVHGDQEVAGLREELEDARMNIEIAIRLRTEAEAELERVTEHRDLLIRQLEQNGPAQAGGAAPVPDGDNKRLAASKHTVTASSAGKEFKYVTDDHNGGKRRWLGGVVGLAVAAIAGLVFWLMLSVDNPMAKFLDLVSMDKARSAWSEFSLPQWPGFPVTEDVPAAPQEIEAVQVAPVEAQPAASSPVVETPSKSTSKASQAPAVDLPKAKRSFRDTLSSGGRGPLMLELAGASYMMGSGGNSLIFEERPLHRVDLVPFSIGKYEVSFAEYDRFARATGRHLPHDEKWGRDDRPVVNVTWKDARAYTQWLSQQTGHQYRLPTEAEWEYAARAGTTGDYWWNVEANTIHANCFNCGSEWDGISSAPVGRFAANSLGLHDTAGNVQEWTEDCYHPSYQGAPADGSARVRAGCTQRVVRGGSYSSPIESLRSNKRGHYDQGTRIDNLGFRVVRVK